MKSSLALVCLLATAPALYSQALYTFESGPAPAGDGFDWPGEISEGDCLSAHTFPYDGALSLCNYTNNPLKFDGSYVAAGNAARINAAALWGNPRSGGELGTPELQINFSAFFNENELGDLETAVHFVGFDLAWATSAGSPASPPNIGTVTIFVRDYAGSSAYVAYPLDEAFAHGLGGSGIGREGYVFLETPAGLSNIYEIGIFFDELAPEGATAEFAIDTLEVSLDDSGSGPSEVYPVDFDGGPAYDYATNALKGSGLWGFDGHVRNGSSTATTFTATWTGSDPAIFDPDAGSRGNVPINPGETVFGATAWRIDTNTAPSGEYSGFYTVVNDLDPGDPDDTVNLRSFQLFDPPDLADNTGTPIDPAGTAEISLANLPAGGHAGALRASVKVTSISISDPRFSLAGVAVEQRLDAGGTLLGTVSFDPSGLPDGTYTATLRLTLEMTSPSNYLNSSQPVPDRVWELISTVGEVGAIPPPEIIRFHRGATVDTITYQSLPSEVFRVRGTRDLVTYDDLPDTAVGDGTVKEYTHSPAAGTGRYFYEITRESIATAVSPPGNPAD